MDFSASDTQPCDIAVVLVVELQRQVILRVINTYPINPSSPLIYYYINEIIECVNTTRPKGSHTVLWLEYLIFIILLRIRVTASGHHHAPKHHVLKMH